MNKPRREETMADEEAVPLPLLTAWVLRMRKDFTRYRVRQLNLEALLSRWPGLRQLLRKLPRNLKAQGSDMVPFDARYWRRGGPDDRRERRGVAAVLAWLRKHPGGTVAEAARVCGVGRRTLSGSPAYQEYRLTHGGERASVHAPTGGVQRGILHLSGNRPRTVAEVARAVRVAPTALYQNRRFQKAWEAYARTAELSARSRRALRRRAQGGA